MGSRMNPLKEEERGYYTALKDLTMLWILTLSRFFRK
jgi:hypothetical protein